MAQVGAQYVQAVDPNPVGSVQAFGGANAPTGWLLCDGSQYSIAAYPELYSVLSTTYGALTNGSGGAGSTHFRVPDLRGRMPMGAGTGVGQGGSGTGSPSGTALTARTRGGFGGDERMQTHTHVQNAHGHDLGGGQSFGVNFGSNSSGAATFGLNAGIINSGTYQGPYSAMANTATNQNAGSGLQENMPPFVVLNYIIKATSSIPRGGTALGNTPPIVTQLPANPQFGEVVTYIADAANGVAWSLQYDASGTYPWKFIGGSPLVAVVASGSATTSTSYVALSGPTLTLALAGDYDISASFSAGFNGTTSGAMGVQIASGSNEDYAWGLTEPPGYNTTHVGTYRKTVTAASSVLTSKVKSPGGSNVTFSERVLRVTPVRVKIA
jgi:microcystin-dependent protein